MRAAMGLSLRGNPVAINSRQRTVCLPDQPMAAPGLSTGAAAFSLPAAGHLGEQRPRANGAKVPGRPRRPQGAAAQLSTERGAARRQRGAAVAPVHQPPARGCLIARSASRSATGVAAPAPAGATAAAARSGRGSGVQRPRSARRRKLFQQEAGRPVGAGALKVFEQVDHAERPGCARIRRQAAPQHLGGARRVAHMPSTRRAKLLLFMPVLDGLVHLAQAGGDLAAHRRHAHVVERPSSKQRAAAMWVAASLRKLNTW